jgi:DNA repair protein RecO (recombination protein O)
VSTLRTEALVLRCFDHGESDRIVHLLTPETGRLSAIAKGARRSVRRFPGTLDLFQHLRITVFRRRAGSLARLEQATLLETFAPLRTHPGRFALACYLVELLDRLAPEGVAGGDGSRLFRYAQDALRAVAERAPDARLRTLLELRALDVLGLCPELLRCVRCGAAIEGAGRVGFHVAEGGPVCGACGVRLDGLLPVHLGTLRTLAQGLRLDLDRLGLGGRALAEAQELLRRFQRFHLGIELRSERFLDSVYSVAP